MIDLYTLTKEILDGKKICRQEAEELYMQPLAELCQKADEIRRYFCSDKFDICTIVNGKCGRCPENCKFCAQSAHNAANVDEYPLLPEQEILEDAKKNARKGILRYSIVTSGKRLSQEEVDTMCRIIQKIKKETKISVCVSFGLLDEGQFRKLKEAGVERVHNNLETSRRFFPQICTTHTFEEKLCAIRAARSAGLSV